MALEILSAGPSAPTDRPALLFVHGMWHGAWCWEPNFMPYFAEAGYPTYAVSLPGHGASPAPRPMVRVSIGDYVAAVVEAATAIEGPVVLVGHSMGGLVVQRALEAYPAAGAALLAAVPHTGVLPATLRFAWKYPWSFLWCNLTMSMYAAVATPELAQAWLFPDDMPTDLVLAHHAKLQEDSYWAYIQMFWFGLPRPSRAHPCPMLALAAEHDQLIGAKALQRTATRYGAAFEVVPDVAHDVMLDPNWTSVAEPLRRWLSSHWP